MQIDIAQWERGGQRAEKKSVFTFKFVLPYHTLWILCHTYQVQESSRYKICSVQIQFKPLFSSTWFNIDSFYLVFCINVNTSESHSLKRQRNTAIRYHNKVDWPQCRTATMPSAGEDVEQQELSFIAGGSAKWGSCSGRWCGGFCQN